MILEQMRYFATYLYVVAVVEGDSLFSKLLNDAVHWRQYIPLLQKAFEEVKVYFKNPRRYSREVVVIISVVILTFLLIMLLVLIVLSLKKQYAIRKASRSVRKRLPPEEVVRRAVIAGSIFGVIAIVIAAGSAQPTFCARCHETQKSFDQWENSKHKTVGCLNCHYEPGILGYTIGNMAGAENIVAHFLKGGQIERATVSNRSCLKCHSDVYERTVVDPEREIKVRHKDIIAGGLACTSCHERTAHGTNTGATFAMNVCTSCHDGKRASAKCNTCHKEDIAYRASRTLDDWPKQKGLRVTCTGCHKPATTENCIRCHGLELPHAGQFVQKHAMEAEKSAGNLCYKCHWERMAQKRMCGCHNPEGDIHGSPESWYIAHRSLAKNNGMACNCHGLPFCARCHDNAGAVYPGGPNSGSANQMHGGWKTGM